MDETQFELDALAIFSHPDDAELSVSGTLFAFESRWVIEPAYLI